jgi:hypothetical protein
VRADEEMAGGIIHKPMFERLILCEYAVADLTAANANVFYELGVRHGGRPGCTVLLFANQSFDIVCWSLTPREHSLKSNLLSGDKQLPADMGGTIYAPLPNQQS